MKSRTKAFAKQFNWKILLIRILVNGTALLLTVLVIPDIYFTSLDFRDILFLAIALGVLNAVVKPAILFLTGQFFFATYGLLIILINALILWILERWFSNILVVNSLFWALVGGAVLGLLSNFFENLLGLAPPIVSDDELELRRRIEAEQHPTLATLVARPQPVLTQDVETASLSELAAAQAALEALQPVAPAASPPEPPASGPPPFDDQNGAASQGDAA